MIRRFYLAGFVCCTMISLTVNTAKSTLYVYEPFADATANGGTTYATGAAVTGANSPSTASGQNNGALLGSPLTGGAGGAKWFAAGPTGANNTVAATNLSIPGLQPSSGGSMEYGVTTGPTARVNLPVSTNSGTLYYSFALKVADLGSLSTSGAFSVGFNNSTGAQTNTPTVVSTVMMLRSISGQPGKFNIGVRKQTGTPTWSSTIFDTASTSPIFVVGSYTFNPSTNDDVTKMWLNPDPSTFLGPTPADQLVNGPTENPGQGDIANISSLLFFRRGTAANQPADMFSDEIRVGTTWADVTPTGVPEAGPMALWGFTGIIGATLAGARRLSQRGKLSATPS